MKWYKEGLRFGCTGCGKCCTGESGYVWVSPEEIREMAKALNISEEEFVQKYTRLINGSISLKEKRKDAHNYDCVFLEGKLCKVYTARPTQCRTFPFWEENLHSKQDWEKTKLRCEGIDHPDAPLIPLSLIDHE